MLPWIGGTLDRPGFGLFSPFLNPAVYVNQLLPLLYLCCGDSVPLAPWNSPETQVAKAKLFPEESLKIDWEKGACR